MYLWFAIPSLSLIGLCYIFYTWTGDFFVFNSAHIYFNDTLSGPFAQFNWFFDGFFTQINNVNPVILAIERYMFTIPFLILGIFNFLKKDSRDLGCYCLIFMAITLRHGRNFRDCFSTNNVIGLACVTCLP